MPGIDEMFREMEFVYDWIQETAVSPPSGDQQLVTKLAEISKFINDTVLPVIFGDLSLLIDTYQTVVVTHISAPHQFMN
jgi:hypothetical protein